MRLVSPLGRCRCQSVQLSVRRSGGAGPNLADMAGCSLVLTFAVRFVDPLDAPLDATFIPRARYLRPPRELCSGVVEFLPPGLRCGNRCAVPVLRECEMTCWRHEH